jgi:hypothetical protein
MRGLVKARVFVSLPLRFACVMFRRHLFPIFILSRPVMPTHSTALLYFAAPQRSILSLVCHDLACPPALSGNCQFLFGYFRFLVRFGRLSILYPLYLPLVGFTSRLRSSLLEYLHWVYPPHGSSRSFHILIECTWMFVLSPSPKVHTWQPLLDLLSYLVFQDTFFHEFRSLTANQYIF